MARPNKKVILTVVTLVVIAFAFFALKDVSFSAIATAIGQFSVGHVLFALLLMIGQVAGMILRFYILLPSPRVDLLQVATAISYGQFANAFLPARAGDVLKAVVVSQSTKGSRVSIMAGAGVLIADKIIDIVALVSLLFIVGVYKLPQSKALWVWPAWVYWTLGALLVVAIVLLRVLLPKFQSKVSAFFTQFAGGFTNLGDVGKFGGALVVGWVTWFCEAFALKVLCHSQGFELDWTQSFFVLALLNIAISAPLSVANVGPFEASVVYALSVFNVPAPIGIAIATVHHANVVGSVVFWSAIFFVWRKITGQPPTFAKTTPVQKKS